MARPWLVLWAVLGLGVTSIDTHSGQAAERRLDPGICDREHLSEETQAFCDRLNLFPQDLPSECTLRNVAGAYGFNEHTLSSTVTQWPIAFIGILDLQADGSAALQFEGFVERGGAPVNSPILEGEWSIEPNCFGLIDFLEFEAAAGTAEVDYQFVAVENATELFLIRNNPLEEADAKLLFRR